MVRRLSSMEMVVFDLDGVLVDIESSWQMVHSAFGVDNEENFQKHLRGQIDFKEFMRSDIRLWNKTQIRRVKEILDGAPLMKGASATLKAIKEAGYRSAIISSGISILAERVKDELGIDYIFANKLMVGKDGSVTGEGEEVVPLLGKYKVLRDLASKAGTIVSKCIVVGDGRYDIPLFRDAGLSIAFNTKESEVRESADLAIDEKDLRKILPWLISDEGDGTAEVVLKFDDEREANAIAKALSPDNVKVPPGLLVKTFKEGNKTVTRIFCIKGVETLLGTLDDLLSCAEMAERVIKTARNQ